MLAKCFGEFMGTLVLILLGDGVVANVLLKRSKAEGAGWMVIASGWAFAVMAGVFAGAILVWLHFLPHWEQTHDQGLKLACFCTAPAIRRFGANLVSEILGTLVLVLVVGAIFSKAVADSGPAS